MASEVDIANKKKVVSLRCVIRQCVVNLSLTILKNSDIYLHSLSLVLIHSSVRRQV